MQSGHGKKRQFLMLAMLVASLSFTGCGRHPGKLYSPPNFGSSAHPPAVRIIVPADGAKFHAPAEIRLLALATPNGTDLGPDEDISRKYADPRKWNFIEAPTYSVEFFAGTNSLGLQTAGMVSAGMKSQHGEAVPFIMRSIGYPSVELVWHGVPAGTYTLTSRAVNDRTQATTSTPISVTVLP